MNLDFLTQSPHFLTLGHCTTVRVILDLCSSNLSETLEMNSDKCLGLHHFQFIFLDNLNKWCPHKTNKQKLQEKAVISESGEIVECTNLIVLLFFRSPSFCNLCVRKFDRLNVHTMKFDDFIQCCVMLKSLTDAFRKHDHQQTGTVTINYEQVRK